MRLLILVSLVIWLAGCGAGKNMSESVARATNCAVAAAFNIFPPTVRIEMSKADLQLLVEISARGNFQNAEQFWRGLSPRTSSEITVQLQKSYGSANSEVHAQPLEFYSDLFARGIVGLARKPLKDAPRYSFSKQVTALNAKGEQVIKGYMVVVKITDSTSTVPAEAQSYCDIK